jgi:hypothetical protein
MSQSPHTAPSVLGTDRTRQLPPSYPDGTHPAEAGAGPVWGARTQVVDPPPGAFPPADGTAPKKRMSTMAKTLTAVGVAAVIGVGGVVAVTSASGSSSSTQQGPGGGNFGGGQGGQGGFGGGTGQGGTGQGGVGGRSGAAAGLSTALHGTFVTTDSSGATVTEQLQTGTVSALSATSLTVQSTDNFSATYQVGSGVDVSSLAAGDTVTVIGTVSGSTVTATSVTSGSTTAQQGTGAQNGGAPGGQNGGAAPGGAGQQSLPTA